MRRHPTAPVNVARMRVAISGTDFTAPKAAIRKFERNQADDFWGVGLLVPRGNRTSI